MRVLVTGSTGFVGSFVAAELLRRGHEVIGAATRPPSASRLRTLAADLARPGIGAALVDQAGPDAVAHLAAVPDIAPCQADPERARLVNEVAAGSIAEASATRGARLVLVSTDQVFDGSRGGWREGDAVRPLHVYGATKLAGERAVREVAPDTAIVRPGLVTGRAPAGRRSSTTGLLDALGRGESPGMFTDEIRSPIRVVDLARAVADLLERPQHHGLFHAGGPEALTRHELGVREARAAGIDPSRLGTTTRAAVGRADERPADLGLDSTRLARALGWEPAAVP